MKTVASLLLVMGAMLLIYAIIDGVKYQKIKNRIRATDAVIYNITTASAESMRVYNSKWATVSFTVEGKTIVSENRIQVPMNSKVGDKISVRFDSDYPNRIIKSSTRRSLMLLCTAIVLLLVAIMVWLKVL